MGGYTHSVGVYTPTFTLHADFHGDHESGLRCGCSLPTFPSIRHVQVIAHGCACSRCKMGLKMEVGGRDIFLFWHRTMILTVLPHAGMFPTCGKTSKHMPHLPKQRVIAALNPKNGHFDNNVLKSLHFKTLCTTPACTTPRALLAGVFETDLGWRDVSGATARCTPG